MRFVLTNDDGIDAVGIRALERAVDGDAIVVAPKEHQSGCSHQATYLDRPIHVHKRDEKHFAVDGTPADCTRIALFDLNPRPEFLLSGINAGGNLGGDVWLSGTVAAAREAAFMGVPSIAFSQYFRSDIDFDPEFNWELAAKWTRKVLDAIRARPQQKGTFWNVNFPHLSMADPEPEVIDCPVCTQPLPIEYEIDGEHYRYRGKYATRARDPKSDVDLCFGGKITISRLHIYHQ